MIYLYCLCYVYVMCSNLCMVLSGSGANNVKPEVPGNVAHESFAACPAPVLRNVKHFNVKCIKRVSFPRV